MNALAQLLHARGVQVSGSDRLHDNGDDTEILNKLVKGGIQLCPQDGSAVTRDTTALVVSTAIEDDNPDIAAAQRLEVPIVHRARMLAECVKEHRCIAVGGTSGKTTITGMLGWIFEQVGADPTVVNGAPLLNWADCGQIGNVRVGESDIAIIEADESDKSLLGFSPEYSTVSNISRDHFALDETFALFRDFAIKTARTVVCGPDVPLGRLDSGNLYKAEFDDAEIQEGFLYKGVPFKVKLPGRHNLENALVAVALCDRFGLDLPLVKTALASFKGIERRLQKIGELGGVSVFDDYAHNPAKIAAAWRTLASEEKRILGVWRPHGFGPLHAMRRELVDMFRDVCGSEDRLFILPVYYVGGTTARRTTSQQFVDVLRQEGVNAELVEDYEQLMDVLRRVIVRGDTVLCMGARDPELPRFAVRIFSDGL